MADIFTIENLFTLAMLILLQAVLGFDNLLYISIESKRVEVTQQARVRRIGIGLAIVLLMYRNRRSIDLTEADLLKG